jgi:hypothetical protein
MPEPTPRQQYTTRRYLREQMAPAPAPARRPGDRPGRRAREDGHGAADAPKTAARSHPKPEDRDQAAGP